MRESDGWSAAGPTELRRPNARQKPSSNRAHRAYLGFSLRRRGNSAVLCCLTCHDCCSTSCCVVCVVVAGDMDLGELLPLGPLRPLLLWLLASALLDGVGDAV